MEDVPSSLNSVGLLPSSVEQSTYCIHVTIINVTQFAVNYNCSLDTRHVGVLDFIYCKYTSVVAKTRVYVNSFRIWYTCILYRISLTIFYYSYICFILQKKNSVIKLCRYIYDCRLTLQSSHF